MSLSPTSKSNSCAICENASGKCRQGKEDLSYWQCMTYADAKKGDLIGHFRCVGQTKNALWAAFKPDNSTDWTQQQRLEWQQENQRRQQQKAKEELPERALPIPDRDKAIRNLHRHFGLSARHREDLRNRGLSDSQINHQLYFTINPNGLASQETLM